MARAVAAAIALALVLPASAEETGAALPASSTGSASCRGPARFADFRQRRSHRREVERANQDDRVRPAAEGRPRPNLHRRRRRRQRTARRPSLPGATIAIGSDKRRLTFMNVRGHAQSANRFRLAGSRSFVSDTSFFGDVMTESLGRVGKIVHVDCR